MLARELGYGHPNRMYADLTADEIIDWLAYYSIEPFGERRADWRMASIMALIANANRDPKKRRRPFRPDDFLPKPPKPPPTPEEVAAKTQSILSRYRGRNR